MQSFIIKLENQDNELINDENICCYLIDSSYKKEAISPLADKVHKQDKLILVEGKDADEICQDDNLDGVVIEIVEDIPHKKKISELRSKIGKDRFIGIICPLQRHAAMLVSETEPEFVAFRVDDRDKAAEIISWYNELFLIQSAVLSGKEECDLREFDTDFLILTPQEYKILVAKKERLD